MNRRSFIHLLAFTAAFAVAASAWAAANQEKGPTPITISKGQKVELKNYLVSGKTTVFDFYSEYCPPCRALSPRLEQLLKSRDDIAVVRVDINRPDVQEIDWQSPVAREFDLQSIPHLKVYGPDGKLLAEGQEARDMVEKWMR
jgi:thiol-disulfide isomerase/thioredoxin